MTEDKETKEDLKTEDILSEEDTPFDVDWKNIPKVSDLKQNLEDAQTDHSKVVSKIDAFLANLHLTGAAKHPKKKGKSSVQPKVIRKQAEWRYSALSEPFLSTEDVFNVAPATHLDTDAAKQNEMVLNFQFNNRINKVKFIDEFVRTAVDEGTVIVRTGWDFQEDTYTVLETIYEYAVDSTQESVNMIAAASQQISQGLGDQLPKEIQEAVRISQERNAPFIPVEVGIQEVEKSKVTVNQPTLDICNYKDVIVDPTCKGDLDKASFIIYRFTANVSELKKDGRYRNVDKIDIETNSPLNEDDSDIGEVSNFKFKDKPRQQVMAYEYWGNWDIDGDGVVKPIVATWVGNTLIRLEENPFPDGKFPFVIIPYLPVRRSLYGEPDGALIEDNQKIIGAITRGMIDLLARSANSQTGMRKDMLDLTNARKFQNGEDYEFNPNVDPKQGVHTHVYPEVPNSVPLLLNMQNADAESLTGVKAFSGSGGITGSALGDNVGGIKSALDAAAKRELAILRRLASGIIEIGRKIISMNSEWLEDEEVIRITDEQFIPIKRDDLAGNFDLKLSISTAEADEQKAKELAFMLQTMGNNMDPKMSYMILADIARLRKMPELAKRIEEYEPQPDPLAVEKAKLEIEALKAQIAKDYSIATENNSDAALNQAKVGTEAAKTENLISDTDKKNLDFVEQESGVTQEREIQKQGAQARSNIDLEIAKSVLNQDSSKTQKA